MVTITPTLSTEQPEERPRTVRVLPKDDNIRQHIRHPNGVRFGKSLDVSVEWPMDQFTRRRIRDGDVTVEEKKAVEEKAPEEKPVEEKPAAFSRTSSSSSTLPPKE